MESTQSFSIAGMTCGNCVAKVQKRLGDHPAIVSATVTLSPPRAVIITAQVLSKEILNDWLKPIGDYRVSLESIAETPPLTYRPLLIILGYLIAVTGSALFARGHWETSLAMRLFMAGFFITFSFFKMLDLSGFAAAYRGYDVIAKVWPGYGFIYPFIELALGLAYLADTRPLVVNSVTAAVMFVSLVGVLRAVFSKQVIRCACLGTVFQLPMSTVTIIEDGLMLAMALSMILMN